MADDFSGTKNDSELEEAPEEVEGEIHEGRDPDAPSPRVVRHAQSFKGPLPSPEILAEYDRVKPGLKEDIVEQWKLETAHRHKTIDALQSTDREAMRHFYQGNKRGQWLGFALMVLILGVVVLAILESEPLIGVTGIFVSGGAIIWAMRRSPASETAEPKSLDDGDAIESVPGD